HHAQEVATQPAGTVGVDCAVQPGLGATDAEPGRIDATPAGAASGVPLRYFADGISGGATGAEIPLVPDQQADDEAAVVRRGVARIHLRRTVGPGGRRLEVGLGRLLGLHGTSDDDVIDVPPLVTLRSDPGAHLLVRRGGLIELPGLGDPADAHPLAEETGQVEAALHPQGPRRWLDGAHHAVVALERAGLVARVATAGPDAERIAQGLVHTARRRRRGAGVRRRQEAVRG